MNSPTNPIVSENQFTHLYLKAFARQFGQAHIDLACHAAFPLALTPELLYCLRENFVPDVPWIAVADILLFLCDPVGYQLYEMEAEVRDELLRYLVEHFGKEQLFSESKRNLSDFMVAYIRQQLKTKESADRDLGAAPQWTALAYTNSKQAVHDIAEALKKALKQKNPAEWIRLTSIIESYNLPILEKFGFEPLLVLARGWDAKARGEEEAAAAEFNQLGNPGKQVKIAGVTFKIPPAHNDDKLYTFDFEVVTVNRRGEIIQKETKQAEYFIEDLGNGITIEMVAIPGGKFMMGSSEEEGDEDEYPQHEVTIQPFFMSKYSITQAQWQAVAKLRKVKRQFKHDPSSFNGDRRPVESVSWYDVREFCARLSQKTGQKYRLPSEAEWEYACRAGTTTPFYFGETITDKLANYNASKTFAEETAGEYRQKTTPVGQFPPNAFGLYDMHGNVWEWCADIWHENYRGAPTNCSAWVDRTNDDNDNSRRLLRGGSWNINPGFCRSAARDWHNPDNDFNNDGFRVVCGAVASALLYQN